MHLTRAELDAGLEHIRKAPADGGTLELIVRRPAVGSREVLAEATLDSTVGLVGDTWQERPSTSMPEPVPHPEKQITIMNARCALLVAGSADRRPLAGDQLYADLDLSVDNVPAGTRLRIGSALLEVSAAPHRGCAKFTQRFGLDAMRFVNSLEGQRLNLRGINTWVIESGVVRQGDAIHKV